MSDDESPVPEEVLTSAKDQLDDDEISLADNEEILHALSELAPVYRKTGRVPRGRPKAGGFRDHENLRFSNDLTPRVNAVTK